MAYNALDISRYVINYACKIGKPISNLQLQKIMYYIQAAFLTEKNEKCFNEDIINWAYGPVIENVYREYKIYGPNSIPKQESYKNITFDKKNFKIVIQEIKFNDDFIKDCDKKLIQKMFEIYGGIDPFVLVDKTHLEDPWKNSNQNDVITVESIAEYYKAHKDKLYNEKEVN